MSPFKFKFTALPWCDSEGFPSEIADMQVSSVWLQMHNQLHRQYDAAREATCPSKHWNDGTDICADCGTDLNPGEPQPVKLSEMTDQELNEVHSHWLRNGRSE